MVWAVILHCKSERNDTHMLLIRVFFATVYVWQQMNCALRNWKVCVSSKDTDLPGPLLNLERAFSPYTLKSQRSIGTSYGQQTLWNDCTYAQADLNHRWLYIREHTFSHGTAQIEIAIYIAHLEYFLNYIPCKLSHSSKNISNLLKYMFIAFEFWNIRLLLREIFSCIKLTLILWIN